MARSYPQGYAVQVEPGAWVSQWEAAQILGVGILRIGWLVANGHLEPAETEGHLDGIDMRGPAMGVTRASLKEEQRWRREAPRSRRLRRGLVDTVEWVLSGI